MLLTFENWRNPEQEAVAHQIIKRAQPMFPEWVERLRISMNERLEDAYARAGLNYEYLSGTIEFSPCFFALPPLEQTETVMHELIHVVHEPLLLWVRDYLIDPLEEKNPEVHAILKKQFSERKEQFTESIGISLARLLGPDTAQNHQKQTCKHCRKPHKVEFHVCDKLWREIVPVEFQNLALCLECFDFFASKENVFYLNAIDYLAVAGDLESRTLIDVVLNEVQD